MSVSVYVYVCVVVVFFFPFKPGANLLSAMPGCFVFAAVFDSATARERED